MLIHSHLPLLLLPFVVRGPTAPRQAPGCVTQIEWAAEFASRNYAGYQDKVTPATRPAYQALLDSLREQATNIPNDAQCDPLLRRWVAFFRDRHLGFSRRSAAPVVGTPPTAAEPPNDVRARFANWERRAIDEAQVRSPLDQPTNRLDPIEGIWQSSDGAYRVAILRDSAAGREFAMTILRADSVYWMPGQLKAAFVRDGNGYTTRFFMRDHSEQAWSGRVERNVLRFSSGSMWIREWPARADDITPMERRMTLDGRFAAYDVAPGTVLVRIPTFNDPKGIDSLFNVEGERIRNADRLIIDVRGNGGGSDYNYRELTPLLYTGPVRLIGVDMLATEDNIASQFALGADTAYPEGQRRQILSAARAMEHHRGEWMRGDDGTRRGKALAKPRVVAILVDAGCASSCEQFLLEARQSAKVTLYGSNSGGVLDYGNVRGTQMPGSTLVLQRPITRTRRLPREPIDNIGIPPNVRIPEDIVLQVPWVLSQMKR